MPRRKKNIAIYSEEFKQLQRVWDRKLKESGFKDIEKNVLSGMVRQEDVVEARPGVYLNKAEADTLRHDFLREYEFESQRDRKIWTAYTENGGKVPSSAGFTYNVTYKAMRRLKQEFKKWHLEKCAEASNLVTYDDVELTHDLDMLDGARAMQGQHARKGVGEIYDPSTKRWKSSRTFGGEV